MSRASNIAYAAIVGLAFALIVRASPSGNSLDWQRLDVRSWGGDAWKVFVYHLLAVTWAVGVGSGVLGATRSWWKNLAVASLGFAILTIAFLAI